MASSCEQRTFVWTREITKDLITLYEAQPTLYITKLKEYKNKTRRAEAILFIKNELQHKYPIQCQHLTEECISKKIHVIRTQYLKEASTLKKFLSSGASADSYTPKLWCFDILGFLTEGDPVRESESNYSQYHNDELSEVVFEGTVDELGYMNSEIMATPSSSRTTTPEHIFSNNNKRKASTPAVASLINTAVKSLEEHSKRRKADDGDEFDVFGRTVSAELRKVNDADTVRILKKNIFCQIIDAQQ